MGGLIAVLLVLLPAAAEVPMGTAPPVVAAPLQGDDRIVVDGVLDEEAWSRAQPITDFVGIDPTEGFAPSDATTARILFDDDTLYVGWRCESEAAVRGYFAEREDVNLDDQVGLYLDAFGDARRMVVIYLNALGVQQDALIGSRTGWNGAFDAVMTTRGRIDDDGYTVELALPFRSLRFPKGSPRPWRIQLTRRFAKSTEKVSYPAIRRDLGSSMLQMVPLLGVEPERGGVGLELLPTVTVRAGQDREDGGLTWRPATFPGTVDPGFGLKWQATPALTLDATVNPDFSQIEADPNFLDHNLRFALFLEERRPFFVEGRELFESDLLYSRAIVDPVYGLKFSGKAGPASIAVLHTLDESPSPSLVGERTTPGFTAADTTDALSFVTYAGGRFDLGRRSQLSAAFSDKELIGRDGTPRGSYRAALGSTRLAVDDVTTIDLLFAGSEAGAVGGDRLAGMRLRARADRTTRLRSVAGGIDFQSPDYRAESGFVTRPDFGNAWIDVSRRFEWAVPWQGFVQISADVNHSIEGFDTDLAWAGNRHRGEVVARLPGVTDARMAGSYWVNRFGGQLFDGGTLGFELSNRALEFLRVALRGTIGDAIRFSDRQMTFERRLGGDLWLRALRRINLRLDTDVSWLGEDDQPLTRRWVWRARLVFGIVQPLQLRLIAQGADEEVRDVDRELIDRNSDLRFSALLTFLLHPGTSVHVGFGEHWRWGVGGKPETQQRDLFLKGSLLIRL